ncbi:hypothetical protein PILCRDRAFT_73649 [Piloderma croceum F 1598]|uniref:Uncharacterized protein n=1 Tax=Piloderma croceum (strain F 1598) TaxID=765440 RepID=A0A0C3B127_PILCF|nr:hypothetical protein PILCRDRAFT_73649 [Piloderma croceum F 1598]
MWYDSDDESSEHETDDGSDGSDDPNELQNLMDNEENPVGSRTIKQDKQLLALTYASLSITVDELTKVHALPDADEEQMEELIAEEYRHIKEALSFNFPSARIDEVVQPLGYGATNPNFDEVDFDVLVRMHRQHQTHHATMGVWTKGTSEKQLPDAQKNISLRQQIIRRFHEVLKEEQDRAPCTGSDRKIHWRAPAPGARDGQIICSPALINQAATRRRNLFMKANVPCINEVGEACVSSIRPLKINDFGFIYLDKSVMIGQVVALYAKTGGKNGKHMAITDSSNVSTASYIGVQVFEHMYSGLFRVIPEATALFFTKRFALLQPISFLCLLSSLPDTATNSNHLELARVDLTLFQTLQAHRTRFESAMTLLRKRKTDEFTDK